VSRGKRFVFATLRRASLGRTIKLGCRMPSTGKSIRPDRTCRERDGQGGRVLNGRWCQPQSQQQPIRLLSDYGVSHPWWITMTRIGSAPVPSIYVSRLAHAFKPFVTVHEIVLINWFEPSAVKLQKRCRRAFDTAPSNAPFHDLASPWLEHEVRGQTFTFPLFEASRLRSLLEFLQPCH
jgi:hypothetical protein